MVSGTISLPCSGFFSPFLHSTRSLSVSREYLALPDGPGRFAQDSSCPALLRIPLCCISLHILDYHRLWSHFPKCSVHDLHTMSRCLQPQPRLATPLVWAVPRSLATTRGIIHLFSLPAGTKMFQFPALALLPKVRVTVLQTARLSHSEIFGSKVICTYPKLIAAYHVLHRLREPRHPPYALSYFLYDCILVTRFRITNK